RPDLTPRVAKCSDYGDWLWWHEYNSMPYCMYNRVTATPEDWCYMTGQLVGAQTFGNDNLSGNSLQRTLFVARADQNGEWQWGLPAIAGSFPSSAFPMDIIPIDTDNFIVVGRYSSSGVTFGNIVIPPANQTSAFIAKGGTEIVSNTDLISTRPGIKLKVFPNPFSDKLRLDFTLNKAKALSAGIYNIKGQCLKHFESAVYSKGKHSIYWDGKTSDGMQTASGVYLIKLQDENRAYSRIIVKK
ncbi:MAG: T9SS type A sorting domain-containing protein, partial [Candidatus Cloacimonetes bacterium]|nr:T9SS type A sorting domain-containing protein [Candidatus Cloacimonadota bacterium]